MESWLISFYNRPYHLEKKPTFEKFLKEPQVSNEKIEHRFETNKIINDDDNEKNIFDIRYYKLGHILEFIKTHNDCIMVSLSYLQKNYIDFLISLNDEYNLGYDHSTFMPVEKHLKTGKREQNKIYDKTEFESFKFYIESQKNSEIENALPDFLIKQ